MVELFGKLKINWLGRRTLFFAISIALLLVGMISLLVKGQFRYGVDFRGGTIVYVRFAEPVNIDRVRELLREGGVANSTPQELRNTGSNDILIEFEESRADADVGRAGDLIRQALNAGFSGKFQILNVESV